MEVRKTTFALFFGNRGFFPASLIAGARAELSKTLEKLGHNVLLMDESETRHGAVETPEEGKKFARFLDEHRGDFGGVILCLPNFGDENGAVAALQDAGVPILVQAYPDELDRMAPDKRRDAFCGKMSIMDVFRQNGVKFTALRPHVVNPSSKTFAEHVAYFDVLCRVVNGMKRPTIGALGARCTAFKTVRIDELTLQRYGITVETLDLSDIFARMNSLKQDDPPVRAKAERLQEYCSWEGVPPQAFDKLARLGVAVDQVIEEMKLDAVTIRCWLEMQQQFGISPCVLLSEMNDRGIPAACEVDIGNAVTMYAMRLASGEVTACLDWNNNYGDDEEKCILFHCGSIPQQMMTGKGQIADHAILAAAVGPGHSYGPNTGRIAPARFTFGSLLTEDGKLEFYLGQGEFTRDPIPEDFFGCGGAARIANLQGVLQTIGYLGHRHHTSVTPVEVAAPLQEAFERYLGYEVTMV